MDYESDPGETKNLAAEQPQQVSRLRAILATLPEAKPQIPRPPTRLPSPEPKRRKP
jgi:hypothetical protein